MNWEEASDTSILSARNWIIIAVDGTAAVSAFWASVALRTEFSLRSWTAREFLLYSGIALGVTVVMAEASGWLHRSWRFLVASTIVHAAIYAALVVSLTTVLIFLYDRLILLPRSVPVIFYSLLFAWLLFPRILYSSWCGRVRRSAIAEALPPGRPLLLVGGGPLTAVLADWLARDRGPRPWYPVGILDEELAAGQRVGAVPVLGRLQDFRRVLGLLRARGERPERILVARRPEEMPREALRALQKAAYAEGIPVTFLDRLLEVGGSSPASRRSPLPPGGAFPVGRWLALRYPLDVLTAAVALVFLAPLLLTAALAVAVTSGRPVLFVQRRPGRNFRWLRIFKLRTMHDYVAADGQLAPVEVRLSGVGRWLRRFRIDELFQLLNVVRGEMALIGPRPLIAEDLENMPDRGRGRVLVRPGITGWAQVNGGNDLSPEEKYALDVWYVAHASPGLDLRIVGMTLAMMLRAERRREEAIAEAVRWLRGRDRGPARGTGWAEGLEEVA